MFQQESTSHRGALCLGASSQLRAGPSHTFTSLALVAHLPRPSPCPRVSTQDDDVSLSSQVDTQHYPTSKFDLLVVVVVGGGCCGGGAWSDALGAGVGWW